MAVSEIATIFWQLGLILVAATFMNFLSRRFKQPPLVGYIVAGIIIGPYFMAFLSQTFNLVVPITHGSDVEKIGLLSQLGVAFLLFSAGIESDLFKLKRVGSTVILGGITQVILTIIVTVFLSNTFGFVSFVEALYFGVILSCSSTMLILKLLSDSFTSNTIHGRLLIGISLVQDAIIVVMIPLLLNLKFTIAWGLLFELALFGAALLILALMLNSFVYPKIFRRLSGSTEILFLAPISVCFVFMYLSELFGIPLAMGAFIAGISLSALPYSTQIANEIRGVRDFFVTIFFVTLGMQLNVFSIPSASAVIILAMVIAFVIKPLIIYAIIMAAGYGNSISVAVAFCLIPLSEYSFLLAMQGHTTGFLTDGFYSAVIFVISISMIITPYIFKYHREIENLFGGFFSKETGKINAFFNRKIDKVMDKSLVFSKIIIAGGGIMGGSIAKFLKNENPIVIDHDPDVVLNLRKEGITALYGEIDNPLIWKNIKLDEAKVLIIAVPSFEATLNLLNYAKKENPKIVIFARAHSFLEAKELYLKNADFVCLPEAAASNLVIKEVMEYLHTGSLTRLRALHSEMMCHIEEAADRHEKKKKAKKNTLI
ncbi:MAG: cation:proton antiporter [Candidatus Diapherotrites archaeon]